MALWPGGAPSNAGGVSQEDGTGDHVALAAPRPRAGAGPVTTSEAGPDRRRGLPADPPVVVVGLRDVADEGMLRAAFGEAVARTAVLHVVHAWDAELPGPVAVPTRAGGRASMTRVHRDVFAAVTAVAADFPGVQYAVMIVQGEPTTVLLERSQGASLLIIGRLRPETGPDVATGGTGRELMAQAPCPVLVLHLGRPAAGSVAEQPRTRGRDGDGRRGEPGAMQMPAL